MFQPKLFQEKERVSIHQIPDEIRLKVVNVMAQMIIISIVLKEGEADDDKASENN